MKHISEVVIGNLGLNAYTAETATEGMYPLHPGFNTIGKSAA